MGIHVSADNFVRAETDRMFADLQRDAGGINAFSHNRTPAAIERQTVVRLNRDTLYSFGIADLDAGATLTLPEHGNRYLSAMVVNNDHYINAVYHDAGSHKLSTADHGTRYVMVGVRIFADPNDPDDLAEVAGLQDQLSLTAESATPFVYPDYDPVSLDATRDALLALVAPSLDLKRTFGRPDQVDPVGHLMGTAAGWGGLPSTEAVYVPAAPEAPGNHELTLADVPVDGFWSVSVYNAKGFFEPNDRNSQDQQRDRNTQPRRLRHRQVWRLPAGHTQRHTDTTGVERPDQDVSAAPRGTRPPLATAQTDTH